MSIIRVEKRRQFAVIAQSVFNDKRLDHKSLGVLAYLLSRPDNWTASSHHLSQRFGMNAETAKKILADLEEKGYLVRRRIRNEAGQFTWTSCIYEDPIVGKTSDGKTMVGKTVDGKTSDGKSDVLIKTDSTKTDLTNQDQQEDDPENVDPFYSGQHRAIAREVVKVSREMSGPRNFITDAPWGKLAEETGKDATAVFQAFEAYLIQCNSDKEKPEAYAAKVCSSIWSNPGSEFACQPWKEFKASYEKNRMAPPRPAKNATQDVMTPPTVVDDQTAANARERLKKLRNGGGND